MKTILCVLLVLLLALTPATARADVTATATISVTVLPSPLDAAVLPGCVFVVHASSESSLCNATLIVADPTLSMTGWRVTLAASGLTCECHQTLPSELLTVQAVVGPTLVNGQPVDTKNGPIVESGSLGQSLKTPVPITHAQPDFGNGAYSYTLVLRLTVPDNATAGTYVPEWVIGVSPAPSDRLHPSVDVDERPRYRAPSCCREPRKEADVSDRAEALARRFERAHQEFLSVVQLLSPSQWQTLCPDDQCSVAALTRHVAIAIPFEVKIFTAIAAGQPTEPLTWAWLANSNAEDAVTHAACDQTETLHLLNQNAANAATFIRSLDADQLARTGLYLEDLPALTLDRWVRHILIGHITTHLASIRSALGIAASSENPPKQTLSAD